MFGKKGHRHEARGILREMLRLLPNLVKLLYRLLRDSRVPLAEKALLMGAITYVITPLDFIPDLLPFIGQVDDLYLVSLVLLRLLTRTDNQILDEYWDGPGDLGKIVDRIATAAQYVLPKRVRKVLLGRAVIAPKVPGGLLVSPGVDGDGQVAETRPRRRHAS